MFEKIEIFDKRYSELSERLYQPSVAGNPEEYQKIMKEIKSIEEIVLTYRKYKEAVQTEKDSLEILEETSDKELKELAQIELDEAKDNIKNLAEDLKILLLPKDPNDERNVIVEIRGGAGGQHINKTSSAIRITHLPTGMVVECQDERSQYKNKDKALKVLKSRLLKEKQDKQASEIAENRKMQVGTGDRSERIRTYNYPQGRVTDHRIGLTLYKLEEILNGSLDEVIDALVAADRAEKLKESMEK